MPTEQIVVIDKEVSVGVTSATVYGFYSVPSNSATLTALINAKKGGKIPKILRVRMRYRVEYVRPTPATTGSGSITILDCSGNEVRPPPVTIMVSWNNPVQEGEIDLTKYFSCQAPALGINAVKVELGPAGWPIPIPTTVYKVRVEMIWEWGW